jgi:hypothetical protein
MQEEFNNRIAAQRAILKVVNSKNWETEDLFGLSSKAIERWVSINRIDVDSALVGLIKAAGEKLFFLANKSQEQVSAEYRGVSNEVAAIRDAIAAELNPPTPHPTDPRTPPRAPACG